MGVLLVWLVVAVVFGVAGAMILSGKGRSPVGGFALGFALWLIGVIIALLMRPSVEAEALRQEEIDRRRRRLRGEE